MPKSAVQELAIVDESPIVAASFLESRVQIWSWKTSRLLGEFETILDLGGRRLALTPDGRICIVGSFHKGLAAYSIPNGHLLWHRKDLHKVQLVNLSASGSEIYCGDEEPSVHIIETETGDSLAKIARAESIISSRVSSHRLVARRQDRYTVQGIGEFEVSAISFGLHDAAFSPEAICLSEPKTGIRCVDLIAGSLLWHHPTIGANYLTFNSSDSRFYCVGRLDTTQQGVSLIRLAGNFLDCKSIAMLGQSWTAAFSPSGTVLITVDGEVRETSTGFLHTLLDFPQRD